MSSIHNPNSNYQVDDEWNTRDPQPQGIPLWLANMLGEVDE